MRTKRSREGGEPPLSKGDPRTEHWSGTDTTPVTLPALPSHSEEALTEVWVAQRAHAVPTDVPDPPPTITRKITYQEDEDPRKVYLFLGIVIAIPLAGIVGLPLLLVLLFLFVHNPRGLGEQLGRCELLRHVPGFRSGNRMGMALASALYLMPMSAAGLVVIGVDLLLMLHTL